MQIINRTKEAITLEIVLANGTIDSVNIQPQGRLKALPAGATLNPTKLRQYELIAKIVPDVPVPTAPTPNGSASEGDQSTANAVTTTVSTQ